MLAEKEASSTSNVPSESEGESPSNRSDRLKKIQRIMNEALNSDSSKDGKVTSKHFRKKLGARQRTSYYQTKENEGYTDVVIPSAIDSPDVVNEKESEKATVPPEPFCHQARENAHVKGRVSREGTEEFEHVIHKDKEILGTLPEALYAFHNISVKGDTTTPTIDRENCTRKHIQLNFDKNNISLEHESCSASKQSSWRGDQQVEIRPKIALNSDENSTWNPSQNNCRIGNISNYPSHDGGSNTSHYVAGQRQYNAHQLSHNAEYTSNSSGITETGATHESRRQNTCKVTAERDSSTSSNMGGSIILEQAIRQLNVESAQQGQYLSQKNNNELSTSGEASSITERIECRSPIIEPNKHRQSPSASKHDKADYSEMRGDYATRSINEQSLYNMKPLKNKARKRGLAQTQNHKNCEDLIPTMAFEIETFKDMLKRSASEARQLPSKAYKVQEARQIPTISCTAQKALQIPTKVCTAREALQIPTKACTIQEALQIPTKACTIQEALQIPSTASTDQEALQIPTKVCTAREALQIPTRACTVQETLQIPTNACTVRDALQIPTSKLRTSSETLKNVTSLSTKERQIPTSTSCVSTNARQICTSKSFVNPNAHQIPTSTSCVSPKARQIPIQMFDASERACNDREETSTQEVHTVPFTTSTYITAMEEFRTNIKLEDRASRPDEVPLHKHPKANNDVNMSRYGRNYSSDDLFENDIDDDDDSSDGELFEGDKRKKSKSSKSPKKSISKTKSRKSTSKTKSRKSDSKSKKSVGMFPEFIDQKPKKSKSKKKQHRDKSMDFGGIQRKQTVSFIPGMKGMPSEGLAMQQGDSPLPYQTVNVQYSSPLGSNMQPIQSSGSMFQTKQDGTFNEINKVLHILDDIVGKGGYDTDTQNKSAMYRDLLSGHIGTVKNDSLIGPTSRLPSNSGCGSPDKLNQYYNYIQNKAKTRASQKSRCDGDDTLSTTRRLGDPKGVELADFNALLDKQSGKAGSKSDTGLWGQVVDKMNGVIAAPTRYPPPVPSCKPVLLDPCCYSKPVGATSQAGLCDALPTPPPCCAPTSPCAKPGPTTCCKLAAMAATPCCCNNQQDQACVECKGTLLGIIKDYFDNFMGKFRSGGDGACVQQCPPDNTCRQEMMSPPSCPTSNQCCSATLDSFSQKLNATGADASATRCGANTREGVGFSGIRTTGNGDNSMMSFANLVAKQRSKNCGGGSDGERPQTNNDPCCSDAKCEQTFLREITNHVNKFKPQTNNDPCCSDAKCEQFLRQITNQMNTLGSNRQNMQQQVTCSKSDPPSTQASRCAPPCQQNNVLGSMQNTPSCRQNTAGACKAQCLKDICNFITSQFRSTVGQGQDQCQGQATQCPSQSAQCAPPSYPTCCTTSGNEVQCQTSGPSCQAQTTQFDGDPSSCNDQSNCTEQRNQYNTNTSPGKGCFEVCRTDTPECVHLKINSTCPPSARHEVKTVTDCDARPCVAEVHVGNDHRPQCVEFNRPCATNNNRPTCVQWDEEVNCCDMEADAQSPRPARSPRNAQSSNPIMPSGVIVYQMTIRYALTNGIKVTGGVRVILDLPNKHGYVQIISLLNEVYLTHYGTTMCFLNPGSAAGVAWSALPWCPDTDDCAKCGGVKDGAESGEVKLAPNKCSRVETVQVVFCDPNHAQRFKIVLDTIRTAFCDGPESGVCCNPTGFEADAQCGKFRNIDAFQGAPSNVYNHEGCNTAQLMMPLTPGCPGVCCPPLPGTNAACVQGVQGGNFGGGGGRGGGGGGGGRGGGMNESGGGGGFRPNNMTQSQTPDQGRYSHDYGQFVSTATPAGGGIDPSDPYAFRTPDATAPIQGGDPYAAMQDRILFSAPACLVRLEKKKNWREMFRGTLKIAQRSVGVGFSMMLESLEGTICSHHFITLDMRFERSCKTQFGYVFSAISRGMRCGVRPCMGASVIDDFLISFQTQCPFTNFKCVIDDVMKCLQTTQPSDAFPGGAGNCCVSAMCNNQQPQQGANAAYCQGAGMAPGAGWSNNNSGGMGQQGGWSNTPSSPAGVYNNGGAAMFSNNNSTNGGMNNGNFFGNGNTAYNGNLATTDMYNGNGNGPNSGNVIYSNSLNNNPAPPSKFFNDTNAGSGFSPTSGYVKPVADISSTGRNVPPFHGMLSNVNPGGSHSGQQQSGSNNNNAYSAGASRSQSRLYAPTRGLCENQSAFSISSNSRLDEPMFPGASQTCSVNRPSSCSSFVRGGTCNNNNASHSTQLYNSNTGSYQEEQLCLSDSELGYPPPSYYHAIYQYNDRINYDSMMPKAPSYREAISQSTNNVSHSDFVMPRAPSYRESTSSTSSNQDNGIHLSNGAYGPSAAKRTTPTTSLDIPASSSAASVSYGVAGATTISNFSARLRNCTEPTRGRKRNFSGK